MRSKRKREKSKPALSGGGISWWRIHFKPQVPAPGSGVASAAHIARWSSPVARQPHKLEVAGSNPARASSPYGESPYFSKLSVEIQGVLL